MENQSYHSKILLLQIVSPSISTAGQHFWLKHFANVSTNQVIVKPLLNGKKQPKN